MPCSSDGCERTNGQHWENFTRTISYTVGAYFSPRTIAEVVFVLQQADAEGREVRVVGSGWSIENIATSAEWIIDISALCERVTNVVDVGFASEALTASRRQAHLNASSLRLAHVQAGMKIIDLNRTLQTIGYSMSTLGGAQGQTVAGAISTSTHGSDWRYPPLPDLVQALHLVTRGGRELWIESSTNPLTDKDDVLRALLPCADIEIIRDDDLLNSVLVGVGCFGVIYSVVISVQDSYRLAGWTQKLPWRDVDERLRSGVGQDNPLRTLDDLLSPPPDALAIRAGHLEYRYFDITLNPRSRESCWISRTWETTREDDLNIAEIKNPLCQPVAANAVLLVAAAALTVYAGQVILIPVIGEIKSAEILARAAYLTGLAADHSVTGGRALAESVNAVWNSQLFGELKWLIQKLNEVFLDEIFKSASDAGKVGSNWNVTSGTSESSVEPDCFNGSSIEVVFSMAHGRYLDFIEFLLSETANYLHVGYLSVRFTACSRALLSMHNCDHEMAVSIEVTSLNGMQDSEAWLDLLEAHAKSLRGRLHWGQRNRLNSSWVRGLYGSNLDVWREQLARVTDEQEYANAYTRQRGLAASVWIPPPGPPTPPPPPRVVKAVRRAEGRITHLCNADEAWSPVEVSRAINDKSTYFLVNPTSGARMPLLRRRYLTTSADGSFANNILDLPRANRVYAPPGLRDDLDLRVESIVVMSPQGASHPWESRVEFYCNDTERWSVHRSEALRDIRDRGINYYMQDGDDESTRQRIVMREYFSTIPNQTTEDNLSALPEC